MFLRCKVRRKDGKQHRYWNVVGPTTRLEIDADHPARPATDAQAFAAICGDVNATAIDRKPLRVVAGVEARQPDAPHDRRRIGHRADRFRAVARCNTCDRRWRSVRRGDDYLCGIHPGHQRRRSDSQPAPAITPRADRAEPRCRRNVIPKVPPRSLPRRRRHRRSRRSVRYQLPYPRHLLHRPRRSSWAARTPKHLDALQPASRNLAESLSSVDQIARLPHLDRSSIADWIPTFGSSMECAPKMTFATDSALEEGVTSEPVSWMAKFPASWENTGNFARLDPRVRTIGSESRIEFNGLRPNSLRIGTGNLFPPSRELNQVTREFIRLIRESRAGRHFTATLNRVSGTTGAR